MGNKTEEVLSNQKSVNNYKISLPNKSVVVESTLPSSELIRIIEEGTGKRAVIMGSGQGKMSSAAVAMLGGLIGSGSVQGVVRFMQTDSETCVIDGTIDGLVPNSKHGLAIHECGDISEGCQSVGSHYNPRNKRHGSPLE